MQLSWRMSSITTLFRHCPACGRRFEIRLVGKNPVNKEKDVYQTTRATHPNVKPPAPFQRPMPFVELEEKVRVTFERKGFQYAYKCKHCGHEWSETHTKVSE